MQKMVLYQYTPSGNCYKVRLLLHQLDIPFDVVQTSPRAGDTRTPGFLSKNPIGRVPVLEIAPGDFLPESGAILWYLAEGTPLAPGDRRTRAQALQWMFFEQYSHEPYIAVARNWISYAGIPQGKEAELQERQKKGYEALDVMEGELSRRDFFAGDRYSIADIALYAYTHVAAEGAFQLDSYPAIRRWFERVASQPRHLEMGSRPER